MRKRIKPFVVFAFFACFLSFLLISKHFSDSTTQTKNQTVTTTSLAQSSQEVSSVSESSSYTYINDGIFRPIIDLSGWQLPSEIDYDTLARNISGAIIRVQSGSQTTKENNATYADGTDKAFQTHIKEFQKRGIPVAVYAYVAASSKKEMEKEAESFYKAASKYNPTYYWLDVEEKTMEDMNAGVEAFRAKLESYGVKKIGIYIGTYFMEEHSISTDKFTAIWIPTYGYDDGYYNAAPDTELNYDLHQYTSQGSIEGFSHVVDLNQVSPIKDEETIYTKLFGESATE